MSEQPKTIKISTYVSKGSMLVLRDALHWDDPDHTYNYVKNVLGVDPEDYGIVHPLYEEYSKYSRSELIDMVEKARQTIESYERFGGG